MNQCVNEQMSTCKHAEELAIDHMCDPREWKPVCGVKSRERQGESIERHAAIHHGVVRDIQRVVEIGEAMPDHLRINPKCYYRQTDQNEKVGSLEGCTAADLESFRGWPGGCGKADCFSFLRGPFRHALCETIR